MADDGGTERRLRTGVVGIGSHCRRNVLPATRHVPLDLVACCDVDVDRATSVAATYGVSAVYDRLADMLAAESLDVVLLVVGPHLHPELACEALEAGVDVWMEKPPGRRVADIQNIQAAQKDRVVVVGFKKAFTPATRKVVEVFSSADHGPLRSMAGIYPLDVPEDGRKVLDEGGPNRWSDCCHPLAAMTSVGGPVAAVTVHRAALGGGACILEFASGAIGTLHLANGAASSQPLERYEFYGNGCHAVIENGARVTFQRGIPFRYGETTTYAPPGLDHGAIVWEPQNMLATLENQPLFTQGIVGSLEHFCTCVLEGRPATIGDTAMALHLMQIYEAGLLSGGQRIELSSVG
jgi:predicted dehydrogenase